MKTKAELIDIINGIKPILRSGFKVKNIGIFGSCARDEGAEDSDVDILVELYEPIGSDLVDLKFLLEEKTGEKVDLVTSKSLRSEFEKDIMKEVVFT